ncbi:phosphatidate cytidylyltransferase [Arenibaculum sp.]|uniref:phosphatidate cytidylyltransferase n=1 Tax=Arenibaculum sp. TaxID=2865862 RepID=UPI002E1267CD|nr:phosphatidate cytidylyltransferase [Arenibaculum sp.]
MRSKSSTDGTAASGPSARGRNPDLLVRTVSALVLGPAVLLLAYLGGWFFLALLLLLAAGAVVEWVRLVAPGRHRAALAVALAGTSGAILAGILSGAGTGLAVAVAAMLALYPVARHGGAGHAWLVAFAVPYVGFGALALAWLRDRPEQGLGLLTYILLVVWATDIGAYAAGRTIGGPKLAPRISPKKTWAGLLGGMAAAAATGYAVAAAFGAAGPGTAALLGAALAVVAQAGDLFESAIKRRFDVKDSGRLIPGHGGLLDRIDGLIAAAPVFALFHAAWGASASWW